MTLKKLTFALLTTLTLCASAVTVAKDSPELKSLNTQLNAMGAGNAELMNDFSKYLKTRTQSTLTPILISDAPYFATDEGKTLIPVGQTMFFLNEGGFVRGGDLLAEFVLSSADVSTFPSHSLPDGVSKKADLIVFSDPTCVYCQFVEKELDQYLAAGVKVTLIPFPRAGAVATNPAFEQWVNALCSDNPAKAYHNVTLGLPQEAQAPISSEKRSACEAKVVEGFNLARAAGISGTPYLVLRSEGKADINVAGYTEVGNLLNRAGLK